MSDKSQAHKIVANAGIRYPRRFASIASPRELLDLALPERVVVKPVKGWSTRGVMLLEHQGNGAFFDHLALRSHSKDDFPSVLAASENGWIVEELVESAVNGKPIPFDYKFYCFRANVGMIVQIDRNTSPPKVTLLDENFVPLRHRHDYLLLSENAQPGIPVVPLHAPELLWCARKLSLMTDAPFVSVDLYDSPQGPVFGEFTFSPGGTHKRMWAYSTDLLGRLDALFDAAGEGSDGEAGRNLDFWRRMPRPDANAYGYLAAYVSNGGARAADRLAEFYGDAAGAEGQDAHVQEMLRKLRGAWIIIRDRIRAERKLRRTEALTSLKPLETAGQATGVVLQSTT